MHHVLEVDAVVGSKAHGRIKPHASIFVAALQTLGVAPDETVMVGDSYEDDIEGARALGIRAILLDRDGLRLDAPDRIDTLLALPAALGLVARASSRRQAVRVRAERDLGRLLQRAELRGRFLARPDRADADVLVTELRRATRRAFASRRSSASSPRAPS